MPSLFSGRKQYNRLNFHCDNITGVFYCRQTNTGANYITAINTHVLWSLGWPPIFCQRLLDKVWKFYANDLDKAPQVESIYTIAFTQTDGIVKFIYVGHSNDIRRRLQEHKRQDLDIDEFVKDQFHLNNGQKLEIKWIEEKASDCVEGKYLDCMHKKLGYWPKYNKKHGKKVTHQVSPRTCVLKASIWTVASVGEIHV